MNFPRRFALGLLIGLPAAGALYFALVWLALGVPVPSTDVPWGFIEYKHRIAASIKGRKIILVGGSSVDNGVSARRIQEVTGVPAVNMGYWASLGPEYILYQVKRVAKPGDLVVLIMEYGQFNWAGNCIDWVDQEMLPVVFCHDVGFFKSRPLAERFHMAIRMSLPFLLECLMNRMRTEGHEQAVRDPENHNVYGDATGNTPENRPKNPPIGNSPLDPIWHLSHPLPEHAKGFRVISAFLDWAASNGVTVVATYPNVARNPEYEKQDSKITVSRIRDFYGSKGIPMLVDFQGSQFPTDWFFDTHYHLQSDSAVRRTELLIQYLWSYLRAQSKQ